MQFLSSHHPVTTRRTLWLWSSHFLSLFFFPTSSQFGLVDYTYFERADFFFFVLVKSNRLQRLLASVFRFLYGCVPYVFVSVARAALLWRTIHVCLRLAHHHSTAAATAFVWHGWVCCSKLMADENTKLKAHLGWCSNVRECSVMKRIFKHLMDCLRKLLIFRVYRMA